MDAKAKKKKKETISSLIIVILCSGFMGAIYAAFINPVGLYGNGVTGISQIIIKTLGLLIKNDENAFINFLGLLQFVLLIPFNLLAWYKLSKKYAIYTFISSVIQALVLSFPDFFTNLGIFKTSTGYDMLACVITASLALGLLDGLIMKRGGTSGGIITLCQYINLNKGKSVGYISLIVNVFIIICGCALAIITDPAHAVGTGLSIGFYTAIKLVLYSIVLDFIHTSYNKVKLEIVTEKGDDITSLLLASSTHGVTVYCAVGAYSKRDKKVLNVIVETHEVNYYHQLIKETDPNAFISVLPCMKIFGKFNHNMINK